MRCPVCDFASLTSTTLEAGLCANGCATCGGRWLAEIDYRKWLEDRKPEADRAIDGGIVVTMAADQHARLCPGCSRIMLRYQVGHGLDLVLDVCGACNGFWFDRNEWAALKARGLHDDLHRIATEPWQAEVRLAEAREHLEMLHRKRFGGDYPEVLRVRRWLQNHPQRQIILAFLTDPDPRLG